jgi:hypothetical protein
LLVWLSKRASHSDPVDLKTDLQTKNMVSASATTAERRLRDADSYPCDPATKYLIQEKNRMGRFEFPQNIKNISYQSVEKKKSFAILNDRLEIFDRYCITIRKGPSNFRFCMK